MNDTIWIDLQAIDWLDGEHACFDIVIAEGARVSVDWDDGRRTDSLLGTGDWQRFEHRYAQTAKETGQQFHVRMTASEEGAIREMANGSIVMKNLGIRFDSCAALTSLDAARLYALDLRGCPSLRELDISEAQFESLDLSRNVELEKLTCDYSRILRLDLSQCGKLKRLSCRGCERLTLIGPVNDSTIEEFVHDGRIDWTEKCLGHYNRQLLFRFRFKFMKNEPDFPGTAGHARTRERLCRELIKTEDQIKEIVGEEPLDFYLFQYPVKETMERIEGLLLTRATLLNKLFAYSEEEIERIKALNDMLLRLTRQMYRRTTDLYRGMLATGREREFDDFYEAEGTLDAFVEYEEGTGDFGSVLRLDNDEEYPSDFSYMLFVIQLNDEHKLYSREHIHQCRIHHEEGNTPEMTDEQLRCSDAFEEGNPLEGFRDIPGLSGVSFCYAFQALCADHLYSLADAIRINDFCADAKIVCRKYAEQTPMRYKEIPRE